MTVHVLAVLGQGVIAPSTPVARADDTGLTRGDGCFEGLRIRRIPGGYELDSFDAHLARMTRSAASLGIPFDEGAWRQLVAALGDAWLDRQPDRLEAAVKLVLTRGVPEDPTPTGFATAGAMPEGTGDRRRNGIDIVTLARGYASDSFTDAPWLLGGVKTLSYAINMAAQREAARRGVHEPLFVSLDGRLLEAPTASVVWASGRTLHTVDDTAANGILHSITVDELFERAPKEDLATVSGAGTVADLLAADLVMLVSSVVGPLRVRSIDGTTLETTAAGLEVLAACRRLTDFPT
jgi:4-amino-4-deoxychorismate lyase